MSNVLTFIGSQVRSSGDKGAANAISVLRLDEESGKLALVGGVGGIDNPTWVTIHAGRARLYAASEVVEWNEGTVSVYDIDRSTGALRYLNKQTTLGSTTCHLGLSPDGRFLAAANYAAVEPGERPDQSVALFMPGDGELPAAVDRAQHRGNGPVADRQSRPHAHCALFTADSRRLFVTDLGLDRVFAYAVDGGRLVADAAHDVVLAPGSGPRHMALHPDGKTLFIVHELTAGVAVASIGGDGSRVQASLVFDYPQPVYPSALVMSADGRFLYAGIRGTGEILAMAISEDRGIAEIGRWAIGGTWPRDARISPSGRFLLVANQDIGKVSVFARDGATGRLGDKVEEIDLPTPMCVAFLS